MNEKYTHFNAFIQKYVICIHLHTNIKKYKKKNVHLKSIYVL